MAKGVSLLELPLVNVYLLHNDSEAMLLDSGLYWDRAALDGAIEKALPSGKGLTGIIQTHGHCDHCGNTAFLSRKYQCPVICHKDEAEHIERFVPYGPKGLRKFGVRGVTFLVGEMVFPVARCPVERTVSHGDIIPTPIGDLKVIHTPGHTDGHISLWKEDTQWLFSGDAIINVIPFIRKTSLCLPVPLFSVDMEIARSSAKVLSDLHPSALFAQHGIPIVNAAAERLADFVNSF